MLNYTNNFINHKCVIIIDTNGKKTKNASPQKYDMMASDIKHKDEPNFIHLGYGTCHSVYCTKQKREIPLSGTGNFYIFKKT